MLILTPPPPHECYNPSTKAMKMTPEQFDQRPDGWRMLGEHEGCEAKAADLIRRYRAAHHLNLGKEQSNSLLWHEAQLLALSGQIYSAVSIFKNLSDTDPAQRAYRNATIAFLSRDKGSLEKSYNSLKMLKKPKGFAELAALFKKRTGNELKWPPNIDIVSDFVRCFNADYRSAYSGSC